MKVSREQAADNRDRILDTAARLFRERGFDGIGVADLMREAGLTHGGFYGHFKSKDDLAAEACGRALARSAANWTALSAAGDGGGFGRLVERYASPRHRDAPGRGCVLATLGMEASRQAPAVRRAVADGLRSLLTVLTGMVPGRTRAAKRRKAMAALAGMVGGMVLARLAEDPELSDEILAAVAAELRGRSGLRAGSP